MKLLHSNKPWLALAAGVAVVATLPWLVSEFATSVLLSCLMYIALATSWSLFCGATRYLSLATSAFFGIGAYTSATLLTVLPWPLVILSGLANNMRSMLTGWYAISPEPPEAEPRDET